MIEIVIPKGSQMAIAKARLAIDGLDPAKAWIVKIAPFRKNRTSPQNRYYWGVVLPTIAEYTGSTVDEMHRIMLCEVVGSEIIDIADPDGVVRWKVRRPKRTTTTGYEGEEDVMSTMQFTAYIERVRQIAAEIGVAVPDPEPEYWNHE